MKYVSENCARRLGNRIGTLDLWVLPLVCRPVFLSTFLIHLDLYDILGDLIVAQNELAWVLDYQARAVVFYDVTYDLGSCASGRVHA